MRFSIKAKQVAGVTTIVGLAMLALSLIHLSLLTRTYLEESRLRGELLARQLNQRARSVIAAEGGPHAALRSDPGIRTILVSSVYAENLTYAAIVNPSGVAIAHSDPDREGKPMPRQGDLDSLVGSGTITKLRAIYSAGTLEIRRPLFAEDPQFASVRIGASTLLIRASLRDAVQPYILILVIALGVAMLVAMSFAQWILRPIHVIKTGLTRLGRGEFGVKLDLPPGDEFGDLGNSFNAMSARLSDARAGLTGRNASVESIVEHLGDAVAVFSPEGELLFANSAMRATLPASPVGGRMDTVLPGSHPYRNLVEQTLKTRQSQGPLSVSLTEPSGETAAVERLTMTHAIEDRDRRFVGVMLVASDLEYLSRVKSMIEYSRKLGELGRLMGGVAHEVKNPLNAMMIHLELVKQKLLAGTQVAHGEGMRAPVPVSAAPEGGSRVVSGAEDPQQRKLETPATVDVPAVLKLVTVIADQIRRLDEVVQGILKFTRPEELKLQPTQLSSLLEDVRRVIEPEARKAGVVLQMTCPAALPDINGDPTMLRQALLNLALNACQAMPSGGMLRIAGKSAPGRRVEVSVEDTGVGISPEHLEKIFDLYFTTKEHGSGMGLSMVYRIAQLHDGEIEAQSTPGRGTKFRLLLPQA